MDKAKLVNIPVPEVTLDEIFKAQGADYSKRPPHESTILLHREILLEARELVRPILIWREVDFLAISDQEIQLEDGFSLTSTLLAKMCQEAEKLIITAMTIGSALEERIVHYNEKGHLLKAYAMDAIGNAYLIKASAAAFNDLEQRYREQGMQMTFPMGPGHSYWSKLEDIRTLFHFLHIKDGKSYLRLTESDLILPRKSAAMAMGVGTNLKEVHGKTHCNYCNLQATCALSQSK